MKNNEVTDPQMIKLLSLGLGMPVTNDITVQKEDGMFVLRGRCDGQPMETVKALDAQMIVDYVRGAWPDGTIIKWRILPRRPAAPAALEAA